MAINKIVYGGRTLMDLTGDTATPGNVEEGVTFHDASGEQRSGTLPRTVSADNVFFSDGETFQQKYDEGELTGQKGYTPVRGTDYWTAADQNAIVSQAVTQIQPDISEIKSDISAEQIAREQSDTSLQQEISGKLPKSPANWEPWTAEEQVAARERMSVENGSDFELLVDATLEEEANSFVVKFPKPVRECLYHVWFFNNNGANVTALTKCIESDRPVNYHLLKYTSGINNGNGYTINGYFRYNGNIFNHNIVGYASESWHKEWTTDYHGIGGAAWMNYPSDAVLRKVDGLSFQLLNASHVLNAGAVIRVWGR